MKTQFRLRSRFSPEEMTLLEHLSGHYDLWCEPSSDSDCGQLMRNALSDVLAGKSHEATNVRRNAGVIGDDWFGPLMSKLNSLTEADIRELIECIDAE